MVLCVIVSAPELEIPPPEGKHRLHAEDTEFPLIVLPMIASVPLLEIPPPFMATPLRIVTSERVTCAPALEIVTTVLSLPPSIIVGAALAPMMFKLMPMVRFSV